MFFFREPLLKGKALYSRPPCTNKFRTATFDKGNIVLFFNKTSYPNEEVNRTEPSPSVRVPCFFTPF